VNIPLPALLPRSLYMVVLPVWCSLAPSFYEVAKVLPRGGNHALSGKDPPLGGPPVEPPQNRVETPSVSQWGQKVQPIYRFPPKPQTCFPRILPPKALENPIGEPLNRVAPFAWGPFWVSQTQILSPKRGETPLRGPGLS